MGPSSSTLEQQMLDVPLLIPHYRHDEHNLPSPSLQHDNHHMHELTHEWPLGWPHLEYSCSCYIPLSEHNQSTETISNRTGIPEKARAVALRYRGTLLTEWIRALFDLTKYPFVSDWKFKYYNELTEYKLEDSKQQRWNFKSLHSGLL